MKSIVLAEPAALALLTAIPAFAANSDGGGRFINPNTAPPGFYGGNLQHNQWGPHVIFRVYTGGSTAADRGNQVSQNRPGLGSCSEQRVGLTTPSAFQSHDPAVAWGSDLVTGDGVQLGEG